MTRSPGCDLGADYGFEYSEEEQDEEDVDIENQYYNAKGTQRPNPPFSQREARILSDFLYGTRACRAEGLRRSA